MAQSYVVENPALHQVPASARCESPRAVLLVISAVSVGLAIRLGNGEYTSQAIFLVTVGVIAAIGAVVGLRFALPPRSFQFSLVAALAVQFVIMFLYLPGVDLHRNVNLLPFDAGILVAMGLVSAGIFARAAQIQRLWFPMLLVVSLLLNFWMVRESQAPYIDSWTMQQEASARLLGGHNPYDMTFPDIYQSTHRGNQKVYGDGLVVNNRVMFGFPYPPLSLLLAATGYLAAGDHRYAQAVAVTLGGLFIGYCRAGKICKLAATLFLFTPTVFLVIGRSWTEPFVVMLLAAVVFCAERRSKWLAIALGLALACKQYMILAVPLSFLLLPRGWTWSDWLLLIVNAAMVAMLVTLPLALWNWGKFYTSMVLVQKLAPFRWDALSYLVWYGRHWRFSPASPVVVILPVLGTVAALVWAMRRSTRSAGGFAAAMGLVSLMFFALNKQAFCNYDFFSVSAFCCGVACSDREKTGTGGENQIA